MSKKRVSLLVKSLIEKIISLSLRGNRFYCPLCDKKFHKFLSYGERKRANAQCPECGSLERHRLLWFALKHLESNGKFKKNGCLLHIAPENCLSHIFKQKYDYISIDLDFRKAMIAMDITKLGFADSCFDAIVCNHVLEHIVDDTKALNELYRVLKTGGWAVVQVPIFGKITQEDFSVSDPEERKRLYGQHDHVRTYGIDFFDRLKNAGFNVFPISKHELLSPEQLEHLSVLCEKEVVFCLKQ